VVKNLVSGLWFLVFSSAFRVQSSAFRVQSSEFSVQSSRLDCRLQIQIADSKVGLITDVMQLEPECPNQPMLHNQNLI